MCQLFVHLSGFFYFATGYIATIKLAAFKLHIKRDFLRHKTAKMNDKIRRFGVVLTPLSRKI